MHDMEILLVVSLAVASFAFHVQPAVAQGGNLTLPIAYSGQVLRGDGSQTCHSEEQREIARNQVDNATLSLLQESVVPLLLAATQPPTEPLTEPPTEHSCGGSGWRRVAYLNTSNPSHQCPSAWREITSPRRVCGRMSPTSGSCSGVNYTTGSEQYNQVCGRIIAYQVGYPGAVGSRTIDSSYINGVGVTRGYPRQHIWSFVNGAQEGGSLTTVICPCVTGSILNYIPSFVGQNYFCETGITQWNGTHGVFWPDGDPLWDGQGCGPASVCCSFNSPPWFNVQLPLPTTDSIEVRICNFLSSADTPIALLELYVR